jgi:O-antigen/teichoic acid export membrane protein
MTTKVVKGSLWTLVGQVAPIGVSVVTTPIVIRMLGAEGYGVLALVALIPSYLGFADFGMNIASTKFASEAFAEGNPEKEARIIRTAALIALCSSLPIAVVLFAFSASIISLFNVPENLHGQASLALKFAAITFVLNFLNTVFNTAQLARLRMDLNTLVNAGFRILGLIATPVAIYISGGVVGAVFVLMVASFLTLVGHIFVSGTLLNRLLSFGIDKTLIKPLLLVGGAFATSAVAGVVLANSEKLILARVTSVENLAYYSVAFIVISISTMFSSAMVQSLIPAFSQLLTPEKKGQLDKLFSRALKVNALGVVPIQLILFVIAKPLFTYWAGADFGMYSTEPFYVLLIGVFFNVASYIPSSLLMASGRTDVYAKIYWIELLPCVGLIALLTWHYGAVGAAAAWSIRMCIDSILVGWMARKCAGASYSVFWQKRNVIAGLLLIAFVPIIATLLSNGFSMWAVMILVLCLSAYLLVAWKSFLSAEEKDFLILKLNGIGVLR